MLYAQAHYFFFYHTKSAVNTIQYIFHFIHHMFSYIIQYTAFIYMYECTTYVYIYSLFINCMMVIYSHIPPECNLPESRHFVGLEHYHLYLQCPAHNRWSTSICLMNVCTPHMSLRAGRWRGEDHQSVYQCKTK